MEAEPSFCPWIVDGDLQLKIGLPVTCSMSPAQVHDGLTLPNMDSYLISMASSVALFTTALRMPIEIEAGYSLPLMGKNNYATSTIILQIKGFLRF